MIIILLIIGWALFAFTALLYFVGNKLNTAETNALLMFSLALLLSESFRKPTSEGIVRAAREDRAAGMASAPAALNLRQAVLKLARDYYRRDAEINSGMIVMSELNRLT